MKTLITLVLLLVLATNAAAYCGLPPLPPLPPLGTTHCTPVCICDGMGNCHYQFICN